MGLSEVAEALDADRRQVWDLEKDSGEMRRRSRGDLREGTEEAEGSWLFSSMLLLLRHMLRCWDPPRSVLLQYCIQHCAQAHSDSVPLPWGSLALSIDASALAPHARMLESTQGVLLQYCYSTVLRLTGSVRRCCYSCHML